MERICCNCKKSIGLFASKVFWLKDGYYCYDCAKQKGIDFEWFKLRFGEDFKDVTCEEFSRIVETEGKTRTEYINKKNELRAIFHITKKIGDQMLVDDDNKIFKLGPTIYEFSQIVKYELCEDKSTVMEGGVGRAVVGDMLFGTTGAIVVAATRSSKNICSSMEVIIYLSDEYHPTESIKLIFNEVKRNSGEYQRALQEARQFIGMLDTITHKDDGSINKVDGNEKKVVSVADEIRKFKELLDEGIITQEEFDAKKKQLLNL